MVLASKCMRSSTGSYFYTIPTFIGHSFGEANLAALPNQHRLTAEQSAIVILYVIDHYRREKGKDITRLRFSKATMRKLCIRRNLHESFAAEVIVELAEWGWTMFAAGDDFALIQTSVLSSWLRLGSKRVAMERKRLRSGDFKVLQEMLNKIELPPLEDEDED